MALSYIKTPNTYNFSLDPIQVVVESGLMTESGGVYEPDEDNLVCYIQVSKAIDPYPDHILLMEKAVPYSRLTGLAEFDISGAYILHPTLPGLTSLSGDAEDSFLKGRIAVADMYGIPGYYSHLLANYNFYVIYGSSRTIVNVGIYGQGGFDVHSYRDINGNAFAKNITKSQPDWIFFVSYNPSFTLTMEIDLTYDDGTTSSYTKTRSFTTGPNLHWAATGYNQLEIEDNKTEGKNVVAYEVKMRLISLPGAYFLRMKYVVMPQTDWEMYLVMDNGLGGVESVAMQGKPIHNALAERKTARRVWDKNNYARGENLQYNARGVEEMELSTGWTDNEAYIYHLRQLLLGNLWIIDPVLGYVKVNCKDSKLNEIRKADTILYSLDLTVEMAFSEDSFNNFYKKYLVS